VKARFEFKTEKEYREYLRTEFTGIALRVMPMFDVETNPEALATVSIEIADEIIAKLFTN
jgi:hypothetical protein